MSFQVTLLGTGTSHGVPVIGCGCAVCRSSDPRNQRTRCSAWIRSKDTSLLIDCAPEHRLQALRHKIKRVDAVLMTHSHSDHAAGLDDLRAYSQAQRQAIPVYGSRSSLVEIRQRFEYIFKKTQKGGGKPELELRPAGVEPLRLGRMRVVPVPMRHGRLKTLGWRLGPFAYLTDTNHIPKKSMALLKGLDTLVLDGLRPRRHSTHFNFEQAIECAREIGARRTYLTHLTHLSDHAATQADMPRGIKLAWDGLKFRF